MRLKIGILLILIFSFLAFEREDCSERSKLIQAIFGESADLIEKKYDLRISGDTARVSDDGLCLLGLIFDSYKKLNKEEARILFIQASLYFLSVINNNKKISIYLSNRPFYFKNISTESYFNYEDGNSIGPPDIGLAMVNSSGYLIYESFNVDHYSSTIVRQEESFDDALKIAEESKSIKMESER
jgi:hypothetical protein